MSSPAAIVIPAVKRHTATVIMAHGLGDTGAGWVNLAENFRLRQKFEHVSFIFPHAPIIPISVNMGMRMPGWYDITNFNDLLQKSADEQGILRSQRTLHDLINKERNEKGIASDRIVLGGFSQGAAMSIVAGLTYPAPLAGIFAMSGYLLLPTKLRQLIPPENPNKDTSVWMGHGDSDPLVRYDWGKITAEILRGWGYKVEFRTYRGLEHSADPKEIDDLENWLRERLPPLADGE